jgi:hypothetical protein
MDPIDKPAAKPQAPAKPPAKPAQDPKALTYDQAVAALTNGGGNKARRASGTGWTANSYIYKDLNGTLTDNNGNPWTVGAEDKAATNWSVGG